MLTKTVNGTNFIHIFSQFNGLRHINKQRNSLLNKMQATNTKKNIVISDDQVELENYLLSHLIIKHNSDVHVVRINIDALICRQSINQSDFSFFSSLLYLAVKFG